MTTRIKPQSIYRSADNPDGALFVRIPLWLVQRADIAPGAKLAYGRLILFHGKKGCFPALSTLAKELGVEERQARRYVDELVAQGLIEKRSVGKGRANRIHFLLPPSNHGPEDPAGSVFDDRRLGQEGPARRPVETGAPGLGGPPPPVVEGRHEADVVKQTEGNQIDRKGDPQSLAAEPRECVTPSADGEGLETQNPEGRPLATDRPLERTSDDRSDNRPTTTRQAPLRGASGSNGGQANEQMCTDAAVKTSAPASSDPVAELETLYRRYYEAGGHGDPGNLAPWGAKERGQARLFLRQWARAPHMMEWMIEHMLMNWDDLALRLKIPGAPGIGVLVSGWANTISYEAQTEGSPPSGYDSQKWA